jgi:LysR family transcriptional regulator (chromosome initiation inhibitor)
MFFMISEICLTGRMDPNPAQLAALVAIAETGSFEAAARSLHLTPSAISQRIRALESAAGQVLLTRATPCRSTPSGERLVRLGRQTRLLYEEAARELGSGSAVVLPVAVNADSLSTWFRPVVGRVAGWSTVAIRLHVEDQAYSQELLRRGDALAAVTSDPSPVQGCTVQALGSLRYVPAATPEFAERWRRGRGLDWAAMPTLVFNDKDDLQPELLRRRGVERLPAVVHQVPSSADFYEAVRLGLGWALVPELQAGEDLRTGRLRRLSRDVTDVPLYWQRWRLDSAMLAELTSAVRSAARVTLRPGTGT